MSLLAVERIKLFSTRSPWWCIALAAVLAIGLTALIFGLTPPASEGGIDVNTSLTQAGFQFAQMVILVMATIAVTTEYRFGTVRATFTAVPNRTKAMLAKTAVVALISGLAGEVISFTAWGVANLIKPSADLSINTAPEWRAVAGVGLLYAIGAVIAISVGALIRQTAGAVAILLIWALLVELFGILRLIPRVGDDITNWLPFNAGSYFIAAGNSTGGAVVPDMPYGPWGGLAYFAGIALAFLVAALVVVEKRDA